MSWGHTLGGVLIALVLLYGPGTAVVRSLGFPWLSAAFLAPGVSIPLLIVAGVLADVRGVPFTLPIGATLLAVVCCLATLGARRLRPPDAPRVTFPALRTVLAFVSVAAIVAGVVVMGGIQSPESIAWIPDNSFHLGTVEWMRRHESASLLDVNSYVRLDAPLSYPGGFHVVAAAVTIWSGLPTTAAIHAVLLAVCAVTWPATMGLLGASVWGRYAASTPLLAVLLFDMPFQFLSWGPLWPYLLAMCLLPGAVALTLRVTHLVAERRQRPPWQELIPLAAWLLSCLVIHPSVLAWWLVAAILFMGLSSRVPRLPDGLVRRAVVTVLTLALVGVMIATVVPASMAVNRPADFVGSPLNVFLAAVTTTVSPPVVAVLWFVLTVVGLWRAATQPDRRWVAAAWVLLVLLFGSRLLWPRGWLQSVSWLWWDDPRRVEAAIAVFSILAVSAVAATVTSDAAHLIAASMRPGRDRLARALAHAPSVLVCAVLLGSVGSNVTLIQGVYGPAFQPDDRVQLPRAAVEQLATLTPADALVAANPRRGSVYLYVLGGPRVLYPTWGSPHNADMLLLGASLADLPHKPEVCAAAHRLGVTHVVTGGPLDRLTVPVTLDYSGVDRVGAGFRLVAEAPPYQLFEIPTCSEKPGEAARVSP